LLTIWLLKTLQKSATFILPYQFKKWLKSFQTLSVAYRYISRAVSFDLQRYHRYANLQERFLDSKFYLTLTVNPVIHLVLIAEDLEAGHLQRFIRGVLDQSYSCWCLHLFDSSVDGILGGYTDLWDSDSRVHLVVTEDPLSVVDAVNSVTSQYPNDFVSFIDARGVLSRHALFAFALYIEKCPESTVLYADEDMVNSKGLRHSPRFKPDWNPDLLNSFNYIGTPAVYNCSAVQAVGGFRPKYGDWAEYDLLLRLGRESGEHIVHIDHVLFTTSSECLTHCDDSLSLPSMPPVENNPLTDFLKDVNGVVVSNGLIEGTCRVRWPTPEALPLVSLIIPTRNGKELVEQCVESILEKTTYGNYEILLVDNQSDDPIALEYFAELDSHPQVRVLRYDLPFNFSSINNFAVKKAAGTIVGLINNDIEVISPHWLSEMVSHALREEIGCVGAKLYYPDDRIQHGGVIIGYGGVAGHAHKYLPREHPGYMNRLQVVQNYSAVTAACLVMRKALFNEVGGFNEDELTVNFNDTDLCLKVRAKGYRNLWTPYAELYHHESVSRGADNSPEKLARYEKEVDYMKLVWKTDTWKDPAYNSNLSLMREDFALRELA